MNNIKSPFKNFCVSVGSLPTAYLESMSYYECITFLVKFLEDQVIPSVNNTSEGLQELQTLYIELKKYVDEYFDNLDVQTEINNKLDEMALDGTLADIINQEIFDELNEKIDNLNYIQSKFSENIINGTAQTVLFAGDSLTWGQVPNTNTQSSNPFPKLLQDFVNNWYNDSSLTCLNYGEQAKSSSYANAQFNTYLAQDPDVIFWCYGTNDVTLGNSNNLILENLDTFYNKCIENDIELIVIIPPTNFYNINRTQNMDRLHIGMKNYCQSRGILYIDMYEYVYNLYNTNATNHNALQVDSTHFVDYSCFRDAIIEKLLPITFKQNNSIYNYIQIDKTPNYVQTNLTISTISDGISLTDKGIVINTDENVEFKMNFSLIKNSYLILNGYSNNHGGEGVFTIDGVDYSVNQYYDITGTNKNLRYNYKFPVELKAGLHTITLKSITFDGEDINRFYIYGFTLEEKNTTDCTDGIYKNEEEYLAWSGNETSLTDESLLLNLTDNNTMRILLGNASNGFNYVELHPVYINRNFTNNDTYKYVVCNNECSKRR